MENAGALWNWWWVGGRRNLAAFPLPTLLPQTESSLKSSCPVNSDFYSFNWSTKGFKGIQALWQHLRQEWKSSRGTRAAASPDLQSGHCARCGACISNQQVKMLLFTSSWSVSLLKMRRVKIQKSGYPSARRTAGLLWLFICGWCRRDRAEDINMHELQICGANTSVKSIYSTAFSYPSPSLSLLPLALFSKPRASEHIW